MGNRKGDGKGEQGTLKRLLWRGEVPSQKWMSFYVRVLSRFATGKGLTLRVRIEVAPEGGLSEQSVEATRSALRELGLDDKIEIEQQSQEIP